MNAQQAADLYETLGAVYAAAEQDRWIQDTYVAIPGRSYSIQGNSWAEVVAPSCGFTGCLAGHRAFLDGGVVTKVNDWATSVDLPDGTRIFDNWEEWAANRFGLTENETYRLTAPGNTLDDLARVVDELVKQYLG